MPALVPQGSEQLDRGVRRAASKTRQIPGAFLGANPTITSRSDLHQRQNGAGGHCSQASVVMLSSVRQPIAQNGAGAGVAPTQGLETGPRPPSAPWR